MSERIKKNVETTERKLDIFRKNDMKDTGEYAFHTSLNKLQLALAEALENQETYEYFLENAKVLDIGCRGGFLFDIMKERGYRDFYGVDISEEAIKVLKQKGYMGEVLDIQEEYLNKKFDLIMLRHTLEHTEKPEQVVKNCFKMLDVGGIIYVEVPKRTKSNDKDDSHFSWFKTIIDLIGVFDNKWSVIYHQDDFPIVGIFMKVMEDESTD